MLSLRGRRRADVPRGSTYERRRIMAAKVIKVELVKVKDTKSTFAYEEGPGETPVLGRVYVAKHALGQNPPEKIKVSIKPE